MAGDKRRDGRGVVRTNKEWRIWEGRGGRRGKEW